MQLFVLNLKVTLLTPPPLEHLELLTFQVKIFQTFPQILGWYRLVQITTFTPKFLTMTLLLLKFQEMQN